MLAKLMPLFVILCVVFVESSGALGPKGTNNRGRAVKFGPGLRKVRVGNIIGEFSFDDSFGFNDPVDDESGGPTETVNSKPTVAVNSGLNVTKDSGLSGTGNIQQNSTGKSAQIETGNSGLNITGSTGLSVPVNSGVIEPVNSGVIEPVNSGITVSGNSRLNLTTNSGLTANGTTGMIVPVNSGVNITGSSGPSLPVISGIIVSGNTGLNLTGNSGLKVTENIGSNIRLFSGLTGSVNTEQYGNRLSSQLVVSISNRLGFIATTIGTIVVEVGRQLAILVNLFSKLTERTVLQIEFSVADSAFSISKALTFLASTIDEIKLKLATFNELTLSDKQKLLVDLDVVLNNLNKFKVKLQYGLNAANKASVNTKGSLKVKVDSIVTALVTQMAQIDIQISSAQIIRSNINGGVYGIGIPTLSVGTVGSVGIDQKGLIGARVTNISLKLETCQTILMNELEPIGKLVDLLVTVTDDLTEQTIPHMGAFILDISGIITKVLTSSTTAIVEARLKIDMGFKLTMSEKEKLLADIELVSNFLDKYRTKIQIGLNAVLKASVTAKGFIKVKVDSAVTQLMAEITQIDIQISSALITCTNIARGVYGSGELTETVPVPVINGTVIRINCSQENLTQSVSIDCISYTLVNISNVLLNLLNGVGEKVDILSALFANSNPLTILQIELIATSLSTLISRSLTSTMVSYANIRYKLRVGLQMSMVVIQKFQSDINLVINLLMAVRTKLQLILNSANNVVVSVSVTPLLKFKVQYVVIVLMAQIEQIDIQISSLNHICNKFSRSIIRTGTGSSAGIIGTDSTTVQMGSSAEYISNMVVVLSNLLAANLGGVVGKVDVLVALFANTNAQRTFQIETVVTDLAAIMSKVLKRADTSFNNINLKLESLQQLTMWTAHRLYSYMTLVLNNLIVVRTKLQLGLNAAINLVGSTTATAIMKFKAHYAMAVLTVKIAKMDIRIALATNLCDNIVNGGLIGTGTGPDPLAIGNGSVQTVDNTAGQTSLGIMMDDLLSRLYSNNHVQIGEILNQMSGTASNTLVSVTTSITNIRIRLSSGTQLTVTDKRECLADITALLKSLFDVKLKYELAVKAVYESRAKANVTDPINANSIVSELRSVLTQIDSRIFEALQTEERLNGVINVGNRYLNELPINRGQPKGRSLNINSIRQDIEAVGNKVDTLVSLFSWTLTTQTVDLIEGIVTDLNEIILYSMTNINVSVAVIKARLKYGEELRPLEKQKLSSNLTVILANLIILKAKIELALNAAIKPAHAATDLFKTKADQVVLTLRVLVVNIGIQIVQAIQLQFSLNGGEIEGTTRPFGDVIDVNRIRVPNILTADIDALGEKMSDLLASLNNDYFSEIGYIVNDVNTTASKAWKSVTTSINGILLAGSNLTQSDRQRFLVDIIRIVKSLLAVKIRYVLVLKATNDAVSRATGYVRIDLDNYLFIFRSAMSQMDVIISEALQIQIKLNGAPIV